MVLFPHLLLIAASIFLSEGYKIISSDSDASLMCMQESHLVLNPTYSCCNASVVKSGLNIDEYWKDCAMTPYDSFNSVQKAAWAVYGCILKNMNGDGTEITLSKFAELVSTNYTDDIKSKIIEEAGTVTATVNLDDADFQKLDKLRISYFDVEREVCREMPSDPKQYGKDRPCMVGEEEFHRGGQCCGKSSIPFPIGFNSFIGDDLTLKSESCRKKIKVLIELALPGNVKKPLPVPENLNIALSEMCDLACEMIDRGIMEVSNLKTNQYFSYPFEILAMKMLPAWIPSTVKNDAVKYAMERFVINSTIERITIYEFADAILGNSSTEKVVHFTVFTNSSKTQSKDGKSGIVYDWTRRRFPDSLMHIPILCSAQKEILAFMEVFLDNQNCEPGAGNKSDESSPDSSKDSGEGRTDSTEQSKGESGDSENSGSE